MTSPSTGLAGPYRTLISADTLARLVQASEHVCIVDCRHDLANPEFGRRAYADGHLPGAVFMSLDQDLSGPLNGFNGRHPLPDPLSLKQRLGALGIDSQTQVVAYDDAAGMFAARLWWLLRWLGHEKVAVLDGGLRAWCEAGQALNTQIPQARAVIHDGNPCPTLHTDAAAVWDKLELQEICLIDARSPDRFRGENETLDPVGGHIPGAVNRFFRDNLNDKGRFLPAQQLRTALESILNGLPPNKVVHQCGSGVTACHNLLAMEHAGLSGSRLYPGSWSEWCSDPSRPVATG